MAKAKSRYVCQACGSVTPRWQGQCPDCAEWNTLVQEAAEVTSIFAAKHNLQGGGRRIDLVGLDAPAALPERIVSGVAEFDRAIGGGIVPGSAMLVGGDPGIGKSTLLLQIGAKLAEVGRHVVYVSGEESAEQVRLRAIRLGLGKSPVRLAAATSVRDILTTLGDGEAPDLLVIDSIQTMHSDLIEGAPGTVSQVRASAQELVRFAKEHGAAVALVGHVTKDGTIAGPRVLEHMVDTVLSFEGERSHQYRILRALKNRFGGTDEIGVFAMESEGLTEVPNPSALFLTQRGEPVSGTSVFPALEGSRPVLVEIQALTVRLASGATPRRAAVGWDSGRLAMILAVLEARCGLSFGTTEVYLNVAGGYRLTDPAADLAVAAALVSALSEKPIPSGAVILGEIALSGEIRPVAHAPLRLKESAKLGFEQAWVPKEVKGGDGISAAHFANLRALVDQILGR
ncbi:DNA repair protein RadA [Sphingomonas sp. RG327]|uniref:DNA repair protein RadA n=1 Tax=Sphingomonas anseongensis TaxID=2908207 RepID=A0ABT0RER5_9SPHN|nr:DNA repair protein RadA [Sphingomonas anseongensis]MCL6678751.1 DNA repair protein RadA [Sphingomonas anseongensis]